MYEEFSRFNTSKDRRTLHHHTSNELSPTGERCNVILCDYNVGMHAGQVFASIEPGAGSDLPRPRKTCPNACTFPTRRSTTLRYARQG